MASTDEQSISLFEHPELCTKTNILRVPPRAFDSLRLAPGQKADKLSELFPLNSAPALELNVYTFTNAYLIVKPGLDGVVATSDGRLVRQTQVFALSKLPYQGG